MIQIKCSDTGDTASLTELIAFQGESKKRSEQDVRDLGQSLLEDGLLQPFSVWRNSEGVLKVLDGHGRKAALEHLALENPDILDQLFPVILIEADTEEEAIKACLQMMSTCGKINKAGVVKFAAPVIGYKAPIVIKSTAKAVKVKTNIESKPNKVIIGVEVDKDKVSQLITILKDVEGVNVIV